jgi:hypothetical protein
MENIIEPSENFDFLNLSLSNPVAIQGGAYFTKILNNNNPLYIQTTRSSTRQGLVKSGKRYYGDLMFDNSSAPLINWFENLETRCQKLIHAKSEEWFQNALDISDIENAFNSTIRIYKSGKYYLVRANVKNNAMNEPSIKIYDDNEIPLAITEITSEKNIISILEIQGIKFTSRNFQIEIEVKQIMVLKNELLFNNCMIKTGNSSNKITGKINDTLEEEDILRPASFKKNDEIMCDLEPSLNVTEEINKDEIKKLTEEIAELEGESSPLVEEENDSIHFEKEEEILVVDPVSILIPTKKELKVELLGELEEVEDITDTDLKEFDVTTTLQENNVETIKLKKPNQVYFELYKEAKKKAKLAKRSAIIAYLEAKNIKKTYMIENVNDSDSDFEAEIDEVSESELESF